MWRELNSRPSGKTWCDDSEISVKTNKSGCLLFSPALMNAIGTPKTLMMLLDRENNRIAWRKPRDERENSISFNVRKTKNRFFIVSYQFKQLFCKSRIGKYKVIQDGEIHYIQLEPGA